MPKTGMDITTEKIGFFHYCIGVQRAKASESAKWRTVQKELNRIKKMIRKKR